MLLLSQQGWPAARIADLLGYDPRRCAAGSTATTPTAPLGWRTGPARAGPDWAAPTLTKRILRLLGQPKAWTIGRLWRAAGRPAISLRTLHRRVRQVASWRRPRLVAKSDPDPDQILADLHHAIAKLPDGAVLLAEDETHINLLPWVRSTWIANGQRQQVMTPGKNRRRTIFGAIDLAAGRFYYQVARKAISATFTAFCEQLLAAYPTARWWR